MAEQSKVDNRWRPRTSLYVNVLDVDANEVKILNQGIGPKSIVPWLIEYAGDVGTITNQVFKMKRTGSGMTDTQYTLTPAGPPDTDTYNPNQHELVDLEKVVNDIPYEQQKEFFLGDKETSTSSDTEW